MPRVPDPALLGREFGGDIVLDVSVGEWFLRSVLRLRMGGVA